MATLIIKANQDSYDQMNRPDDTSGGYWDFTKVNVDGTYDNRSYLGYDISSAPAASLVTDVQLWTQARTNIATTFGTQIRRITSSWLESTLCWNLTPSNTTTNQVDVTYPLTNSYAWFNKTITQLYKDSKNAGNTQFSIRMAKTSGGASSVMYIKAREDPGISETYIVITYGAITDYYVKTTGNDSLDGLTWANAWKTINKAATTAIDGTTVHIGFGDYTGEPAGNKIAPQNMGASGIAYTIVNASTGLPDNGTVSVEKNA